MNRNGVEFASAKPDAGRNDLNLGQHVSEKTRKALAALPCFKGAETQELIVEAERRLRNKRKIGDRYTAMLVIAGTRYLDDPRLHVPYLHQAV
jgi:hypothetical protein